MSAYGRVKTLAQTEIVDFELECALLSEPLVRNKLSVVNASIEFSSSASVTPLVDGSQFSSSVVPHDENHQGIFHGAFWFF